MSLDTLAPVTSVDRVAQAESIDRWNRAPETLSVKVWGGDWCIDCQEQLPAFGSLLDAAGFPEDRIESFSVEKADDGSKHGPGVDAYDIELIPTIVVEDDGEEVARFVEEEPEPAGQYLAEQLESENVV